MWAYSWGEGDLKNFNGPRRWQRDLMLEIEEYLKQAIQQKNITGVLPDFFKHAVASGRGPGKSAFIGMISHWFMSTRIGGSTWVAANGEPQLRTKTFPEIAKWVARGINSEFFDINATSIQPALWFKQYIESPEGLSKNCRYYYTSGQLWSNENPDAFAGAHNFDGEMAIFDEASGIPDAIWTVQEGVFTENIVDRFWLVFSNPRNVTGKFHDCFHVNRDRWRRLQIDSRTVEGISHTSFNNIIAEFGEDSDEARVEVYGEFPKTGEDQFISSGLVDDAMCRPQWRDESAPVVIGVDPARGGLDSTVIVVRKGRDLLSVKRYKGEDTMEIVGRVIDAITQWHPVLTVIDEGGLGYGILDRLVEQNYKVRGVNFGWKSKNPIMWGNKRAEMWGAIRAWLPTASILNDKILKSDLISPKRKPDSSGAIYLESKKEMKARGLASPDAADALAVTFAFPVASCGTRTTVQSPRTYDQGSQSTSWMNN